MKKIKKSSLFFMSIVLALTFLIAPFPKKHNIASSAPAVSGESQIIDASLLKFATISTDGQTLTQEEIKTIDSDNDGFNDVSYIYVNRTATINFEPLTYSYTATFNSSYFYKSTKDITITKLASDPEFPSTFTYKEVVYSYELNAGNEVAITNTETYQKFNSSEFVTHDPLSDTETTRTITITTAYTLKADAPNTSFTFTPRNSQENTYGANKYTINFERPVSNFKTEPVTLFTCLGLDVGNTPYTNSQIEKELSYENIKFQITNNNYTETNPLYFDINHNGFVYTFKLFSKTIVSDELLFVEYYDNQRTGNNQSLATKLDEVGNVITSVYKYYGPVEDKVFNTFYIDFNKTGRYEISVYDETYLLNLKDNNYYTTSFYIKTNDGANVNSAFENAYAIMQNYDDEGNFTDYIVSGSTQNANVQITLKNLSFYFENDEIIKNLTTEQADELAAVEFIETTLTGALNIPVSTYYTVSQLKTELEKSLDFKLNCENDSFYEIYIYQYKKDANGTFSIKNKTNYNFTIVKQPKISFKVYKVDENNDPIPIPGTNKFETEPKEADVPYTITPIEYKLNINSKMEFATFFKNPSATRTTILDKTYLNVYTINYAMQQVKIEKIDIYEEGSNDTILNVLGIQFFGVGDITVTVNVNSITTEYTVQSGENLVFETYGEYSISIKDSMGTTATAEFSYQKPTSVSAIILIVLVGVIVLAVVLFVIASRGKVSTR